MPSALGAAKSLLARFGRTNELRWTALTSGLLVVAIVLGLLGWDVAAACAIVLSAAAEYPFLSKAPTSTRLLKQASFGGPLRFAVRVIVALMLVGRFTDRHALEAFVVVSLAVAAVMCVRELHAEYRLVGPLRPMRSRHIHGNPTIDDEPPVRPALVTATGLSALVPGLAGGPWWLIAPIGLAGAVLLGALTLPELRVTWRMRTAKRQTGFTPQLRQVQDFLDDYRPEVVVHLSGPDSAAYQINTWIETLEALDQRVFLVIRDLPLFERMQQTSLPTLALPSPGELLMLDFSSARVCLFPSNTGNNIHLLRLPSMMSAFIGHGDSDKSASNNPFSRGYDELWVAGEAGADRYRRSGLGIHEDQYRFVGRPQVHAISREPALGASEIPTVLYAPTWEGVNLEQEYSSLSAVGLKIVNALLASDPPIRVVYKPHPFTGQRDAKYRAVHERIADAITTAKMHSGVPHRVVSRGAILPHFNEATALVSDISSVLSDFLASEKPYAVFNHTAGDVLEFRELFPSSAAATIIGRDGSGIEEFAAVVTGRAPDQLREYRKKLSTYLLGPPEQRTLEAFKGAVTDFVARSERERARYR